MATNPKPETGVDAIRGTTTVVTDLMPNFDYVAQIRASGDRETTGGIETVNGPWSPVLEFNTITDNIAPSAPSNVTVEVDAGTFIVRWDKPTTNEDGSAISTTNDFRAYMVRMHPSADLANIHEYSVEGIDTTKFELPLPLNRLLFGSLQTEVTFSVSSRDLGGNESAAVTISGAILAPDSPTIISTDTDEGAFVIDWDPPEFNTPTSSNVAVQDYVVRLYPEGEPTRIKTFYTIDTRYEFPPSLNRMIFGTPVNSIVFEISSRSSTGLESVPAISSPVTLDVLTPITNFAATTGQLAITFTWTNVPDASHYAVFESSDELFADGGALASSYPHAGESSIFYYRPDADDGPYYRVVAYDVFGNASEPSNISDATVESINVYPDDDINATPSAPVIDSGGPFFFDVTHDITDSAGSPITDAALAYLAVYVAPAPGGQYDDLQEIQVGTMVVDRSNTPNRASFPWPFTPDTLIKAKVRPVNSAGRETGSMSAASTSAITVPAATGEYIGENAIGDYHINSVSANKLMADTAINNNLFVQSILQLQTGGIIRSQGYSADVSGWAIRDTGFAEFNDVKIRGAVEATSGFLQGLNVRGTITVGEGTTAGSIISSNYSTTNGTGWSIASSGSATFYNVTARGRIEGQSGYLDSMNVRNTITVGDGAVAGSVQSASALSSGWAIRSDGSAEFNNVTARGYIGAENGYLQNLTVSGNLILNNSSSIYIGSSSFTTTSGWRIYGSGFADFRNVNVRGDITATSGTLSSMTVQGTITVGDASNIGVIQSNNYSNTATLKRGWKIFSDGKAEFHSRVVSGGTVQLGEVSTEGSDHYGISLDGGLSNGFYRAPDGALYLRLGYGTSSYINAVKKADGTTVLQLVGGTINGGTIDIGGVFRVGSNGVVETGLSGNTGITLNRNKFAIRGTTNIEEFQIITDGSYPTRVFSRGYMEFMPNGAGYTNPAFSMSGGSTAATAFGLMRVTGVLESSGVDSSGDIKAGSGIISLTGGTGAFVQAPSGGTTGNMFLRTNYRDMAVQLTSGDVRAVNYSGTTYKDMRAASFITGSDPVIKKDMARFSNSENIVRNAPAWAYSLEGDKSGKRHVGIISTDLPDWLRADDREFGINGLDIYTLVAVLWDAVRQQAMRIDRLEGRPVVDSHNERLKRQIRERMGSDKPVPYPYESLSGEEISDYSRAPEVVEKQARHRANYPELSKTTTKPVRLKRNGRVISYEESRKEG